MDALRRPIVWMQISLFFFYTGLESTAGQLLYSLLTESRGVSVTFAGAVVGAYWAALTAGRIAFGQLATKLGPLAILRIGLSLAPVGAAVLTWGPSAGWSLAGAVLFGFSLAPIFPTLISLTPARVGAERAAHAVGFQLAAASLGIAGLPWAVSLLARRGGMEVIPLFLLGTSVVLLILQEVAASRGSDPRPAS